MHLMIQELRVPATQIQNGLQEAQGRLHQISIETDNQAKFGYECQRVLAQLKTKQSKREASQLLKQELVNNIKELVREVYAEIDEIKKLEG